MDQTRTVSAITAAAGKPDRARVHVGRRVVVTLGVKAIESLGIAVGLVWDDAMAARVADAAAFDRALRDAMREVNRRMLSRKQLADKLRRREHDESIVERVLDRLESIGAISDEALGRELVRELRERKGAGPALLRQKLHARGLAESLAEELIAQHADDNPVRQARQVATAQLARLAHAAPAARTRRLWGVLSRRGYDQDTIAKALEGIPGVIPASSDCES